jgi:hypothetical protein
MTEVLDADIFNTQPATDRALDASIFAAPATPVAPTGPKTASGPVEAFEAGYENSVLGLAGRGKLPDVQLKPEHEAWYNKLAAGVGQLAGDFPAMVAGGIAGGIAGSEVPIIGNVVGAGAGAFAVPTAIRESLISAYQNGSIKNTADFLTRAAIIIPKVAEDAVVGGLTAGVGGYALKGAEAAGLGWKGTAAVTGGAEAATLTVAPAALEGRLPEWDDFANAAIMVGGLKAVNAVSRRVSNVFAKTGVDPAQVTLDARLDPQIMDDLGVPPRITPAIDQWKTTAATPLKADGITNSGELVGRLKETLGEDHFATKILEKLEPNLKGYKIEVLPDSEWAFRGYSDKRMAQANPKTNSLQFREGVKLESAFHEVIHEATQTELKSNPQFTSEITGIMSHVRESIASGIDGVSREDLQRVKKALQNPAEFVAYGMSSPETINVLRGIRGVGQSPTMFTTFVQSVAKAFGFGEKDYTAMHDLIRSVEKGVEKPEVNGSVELAPEAAKATGSVEAAPNVPPEIPRAYQKMALDANTKETVSFSQKAELMNVNNPFTPYDKVPGEPSRGINMNFDRLNTTDEIKDVIAKTSQVYEEEINAQRRGKVSWEETELEAAVKLKEYLGADPAPVRQPGTPAGAAELLARKVMVEKAAEDNRLRAEEYSKLENPTLEQTADFLASFDRLAAIQAQFLGARAEVGRALNILKNTGDALKKTEAVKDLMDRYGNDPKALAEMILGLDNIEQAAKFAREGKDATTWEKTVEAYRASLVSGPISQIANILGNVVYMPLIPMVDAIAVIPGKMRGGQDRVVAAEPLARATGNIMGAMDGLRMAGTILKTGARPGEKVEAVKNANQGRLGEIIRLPFRGLSAGDALTRAMVERGEAYALATRQAVKENLNPSTREFKERVVQLATNPTAEMKAQIDVASDRFTFNKELGPKGRAVQNAVRALKAEWALPFVKTPLNVMEEMLRYTPVSMTVPEWRKAISEGGISRDKAAAEFVVGAGIGALVWAGAANGFITGGGDPDPRKRATQMATGWQPYSIKYNDKYYSYQRLAPVGTLMGMYADMQNIWEQSSTQERDVLAKMGAVAFANAITNQTFLAGMTQVLNAINDPTSRGMKFIQNFVASAAVPTLVSQVNQMTDPYQREVNGIIDAIKARTPGMSETLTPKRDAFGEEIATKERPLGLLPITVTTQSTDKVRNEASRLGLGFAKAPDSIQIPSKGDKKLGRIDLTAEQKDQFGKIAGEMAYKQLEPIVNSPQWNTMPDMIQKEYYTRIMDLARKAAAATVVTPAQRQEKASVVQSELNKRMQPK